MIWEMDMNDTVDGRNPDDWNPINMGKAHSQLVQDFFHPQYDALGYPMFPYFSVKPKN